VLNLQVKIAMSGRSTVKQFVLGLLFCCLAVIFSPDVRGQDQKNLENDLRNVYEHKLLSLRNPYFGSKLKFDSAGKLISRAVAGPWSTCGMLQVEKLALDAGHLEIDGKRVILALRSVEIG